jgi:putative peptidoglycan lipid II flippase
VTALLPTLSWKANHGDQASFKTDVVQTLSLLMFVTIPLSMALVALRVPIIQVLFEYGKFQAEATASTASIFAALVVGLMPMAVGVTLSTIFTSLEDTKTPAYFGAGSNMVAKVLLSFLLVVPLGAVGLALATSLKYVVSGIILFFMLQRRLQGLNGAFLLKSFLKVLLASLLATLPIYLIVHYSALPAFFVIPVGGFVGAILYYLFSFLLRTPELLVVNSYLVKAKNQLVLMNIFK